MRPRKPLFMTPHVDGGAVMQTLPGSERMVGGPLMCMFHELQPALVIGDWTCRSLYMHVAHEPPRPYNGRDCQEVQRAVECLRESPLAAAVLLEGQHGAGHPLPGFFTVHRPDHRIDFFAYPSIHGRRHLWAQVYRRR